MIPVKDYISKDIKALRLKDSIKKAQKKFSKNHRSHLPVVDREGFCGTLAKNDIDFNEDPNRKLESLKHLFQPLYVTDHMNWFEVLQFFASNNCNLVPVLDKDKNYIGYYELGDFLNIFRSTPFLHEEGVILTISKGVNDYSFSEISQIVEANNATLFGAFISKIDNNIANIILKLSPHDLNNTVLSFRRYGYQILSEIHEDKYLDNLKERSEYLERFLNM